MQIKVMTKMTIFGARTPQIRKKNLVECMEIYF